MQSRYDSDPVNDGPYIVHRNSDHREMLWGTWIECVNWIENHTRHLSDGQYTMHKGRI